MKFKTHILSLFALVWIFCSSTGFVFAQLQAPVLLCADVQPDGSVVLTWQIPTNVPVGSNYKISRDIGDGSGFQVVNTVGPETTTTYQDGLVNASTGPVSYRLQTVGNGSSAPGNTVSTLFLTLNSSSLSSVAELSWNSPFASTPTDGNFVVYRNISGNGYNPVATLDANDTTYSDTLFGLCSADPIPINYKVSFQRVQCEMFSQETINQFQDLLGPLAPVVETVLINPLTGEAEIYWYPSDASDLDEYLIQSVIYQPGNTTYLNAGYVQANQPTVFNYNEANSDKPTNMVVIAFDSCGNDQSFSNVYTTIFAKSDYQDCSQTASISWTAYSGWDEGVNSYKIHAFINGGSDQVIGTAGENTLNYLMDIEPNTDYCIYIEAISNGIERPSTSNQTCFETKYPEVIAFNYLNRVTTIDDHNIQIDLYQDTSGQGTKYELMRSKSGAAFQSLGIYPQTANPVLTVLDSDVDADNTVYTYKWKAFDGCGQELAESNIGKNMVLSQIPSTESLVNSIQWTGYASWDGGVTEYEVYRKLGSESAFSLFTTFSPGEFSFEENIEEFIEDEGEFCYKIVAVEGANQFGNETTSESNVVCIIQEPYMWIPNTIVINGFNKVFKPTAGFIDFNSYRMEIYNKWGQKIFSSSDIDVGWNGMVNGHPAREDYYRYIIAYRDGSGKPYVNQGVLYVLKDT